MSRRPKRWLMWLCTPPSERRPTNNFPIYPWERPKESRELFMAVDGYSLTSLSRLGVEARRMALPSLSGFIPHPSMTIRQTFFTLLCSPGFFYDGGRAFPGLRAGDAHSIRRAFFVLT